MTNLANMGAWTPAWSPAGSGNEFYAFGNLAKNGQLTVPFPNGSSIIVRLAPNVINGRPQGTELQAQVSFLNEGGLAGHLIDRESRTCYAPPPGVAVNPFIIFPDQQCAPGEYHLSEVTAPKVIIDIEAFDVAYVSGQTERLFVGPERESSALHPFFGSKKSQQLVFTRNIGSTEWQVNLGAGYANLVAGERNWSECITKDQVGIVPSQPNCSYPNDNSAPMYKATAYYPAKEVYHIPNTAEVDLESFYDLCGVRPPVQGSHNPAFGALDYYYSVSRDMSLSISERKRRVRNAWGFVPGYKVDASVPVWAQEKLDDPTTPAVDESIPGYIDRLVLNDTAASASDINAPMFNVQSRVGECIVEPSANFVTGMFVCNRFIIQGRTTPLRIIGTVITGSLEIAPTAIQAGIRWSSVYNTSSMFELQRVGVLAHIDDCLDPNLPHWMPIRTPEQNEQLKSCMPLKLVGNWDPFNWTLVDPDCVQSPLNEARMACKKSPRRFIAREIARRYVP